MGDFEEYKQWRSFKEQSERAALGKGPQAATADKFKQSQGNVLLGRDTTGACLLN